MLFHISETDEILSDNSLAGSDIKNNDVHIGNSQGHATASMRKPIVLSNGASNNAQEVSSGTGMYLNHRLSFSSRRA